MDLELDRPETERDTDVETASTTTTTPVRRDPDMNETGDILRKPGFLRWETALTGGRRLTIAFVGAKPGTFESPCSWDYRIDTEQSDDVVTVSLSAARILAPGASLKDCAIADTPWAVTTSLAEPLGNRRLVDELSGQQHRPIQLETRLVPTWLPADWVTLVADDTLPQKVSTYGPADGSAKIEVLTSPITVSPRLSDLRTQPGWEPITSRETARRGDDGVMVVDLDRVTTIGFEEQGWYYRVITQPDVDPSVVLEFVRSFERPALFEDPLPPALADPVITVPLQPGQEEREAQ